MVKFGTHAVRFGIRAALSCVGALAPMGASATDYDELDVSGGVTLAVPQGETWSVAKVTGTGGSLTKTGPGALAIGDVANSTAAFALGEGTMEFPDLAESTAPEVLKSAFFHVDASDASTMTMQDGHPDRVAEWRDASGGSVKATPETTAKSWLLPAADRYPVLIPNALNGRSVVDFGTCALPCITNADGSAAGYGASMNWSQATANIRELFAVLADNDDATNLWRWVETRGGSTTTETRAQQFVGTEDTGWIRGNSSSSQPRSAFFSFTSGAAAGTVYSDCATVKNYDVVARGFHLVNCHDIPAGCPGRYFAHSRTSLRGGQLIAEFAVFETALTDAQRAEVESYLRAKWFGRKLARLEIAAGTTLRIPNAGTVAVEALVLSGNATLTGTGCLAAKTMGESVPDATLAGAGDAYVRPFSSFGSYVGSSAWDIVSPGRALAAGEAVDVSADVRADAFTAAGVFEKKGAAKLTTAGIVGATALTVSEGTLEINPLKMPNSHFHVDAAATETFETETVNGTNFVDRWYDVTGNGRSADKSPGTKFGRTADQRRPFLRSPSTIPTAHNRLAAAAPDIVDFGYYTFSVSQARHYGAAMNWSEACTNLREFISVVADTDDVYDDYLSNRALDSVTRGLRGAPFTGHTSTASFYRNNSPDATQFGAGFVNTGSAVYKGGKSTLRVDGTTQSATYCPPQGFNVIDFQTGIGGIGGNAFASERDGALGGQRLAEYVCFTHDLTDAARARLCGALRAKWFGDANAVSLPPVTLRKGTTLAVPHAAATVSALTVATNATFAGALTLADGAALTLSADPSSETAVLSASSLRLAGGGTIALDIPDRLRRGSSVKLLSGVTNASLAGWTATAAGRPVALRLADGCLYAERARAGIAILIR